MFKKVLTDPQKHNPNNFVYLVHGFLDHDFCDSKSVKTVQEKIKKIITTNEFFRASLIGCLDEQSAKDKIGWFGGKVQQTGTFGDTGFIIDPAKDQIIRIAWYSDIGSPWDDKELKEFVSKHSGKIKPPFILLTRATGLDGLKYNELIVEGDPETEIKAVYYSETSPKVKNEAILLANITSDILKKDILTVEIPNSMLKKPKTEQEEKIASLESNAQFLDSHLV